MKSRVLWWSFALFFALMYASAGRAAVFLTWDWDEPTVATDGSETIEVYATLSHTPQSTNALVFNLRSYGFSPGSLVDNGGVTSSNPYLLDTSGLFDRLGIFSSDPLETDESITFLWGVLTPKGGQAPAGSFSLARAELGFSSALYFDAESTLTVNVTPVAAVPTLSAPLLLILGAALCGGVALGNRRYSALTQR